MVDDDPTPDGTPRNHRRRRMSTTSGLRKRRTHRFVQVPSETIRDKRLSFRARGLLTYLLDMPEGWDVKSEFLASQGKEGREAIRSALHELGECGYYRLERRQLLNGTFNMGTAISEEPVPEWAADYAEFDGKAVSCIQQADESFKVRHKDGRLTNDGFESAVDPNQGPDNDDDPTGATGDGFSGPGFPGSGSPDAGHPDSGSPVALSSTQRKDTHKEEPLSSSPDADASGDPEPTAEEKRVSDRIRARCAEDDVTQVCEHLAQRLRDNGVPESKIGYSARSGFTWRNEARLLMDRDGRTERQVHNMIDWCQNDSFWKANIQSMGTLREKYDQMRLRAMSQAQAAEHAAATPKRGQIDWSAAEQKAQALDAARGFSA